MLQPIITDKSQYAEAVKGPTEPTESLQPQAANKLGLISVEDHTQEVMINKQWEYLKVSIKKWRTPRTLVQLGDIHFFKKNFGRARDYYIDAIKEDGTFYLAYDRLIFCLAHLKDFKGVDEYYKKWLSASDRNPVVLHNYVIFKIFYYEKNEKLADELLKELDEVLKKSPKNFTAIDTQGFILLNIKNDIKSAKKHFNAALNLNSNYVHSINSLGTCYLREGEINDAIKEFNKVLSIDNKYPPAYENLASAYTRLEDKKFELEIIEKAVNNHIEVSKDWEHKIGWLKLQLGKLDAAIEWYVNKIGEEPSNNLLYNNLGICYLRKNETKKARECFEKAVTIFKSGKGVNDQRSILAFYNLGRICIDMQDYDTLEDVIKDIHKMNPNDTFVKYLRGTVAIRNKEYSSATKYFEDVLKENPNIPELYPDYGFILECVDRDYKKAIEILLSSLRKKFINLITLNNLAYAYIRSGDLQEGEKVLKSIKEPFNNELLATQGLLEFRKGNLQKGDEYYEKAISRLKGKKDMQRQAEQIWRYEQALYCFNTKDFRKSKEYLQKAKKLGDSYLSTDIKELSEKLNKG